MLAQQHAVAEAARFTTAESASGKPASVAGVDQAFIEDDRVVSAAVVVRDGAVVERTFAVQPLDVPYIPGLLAFREAPAAIAALERLRTTVDVVLVDGNGRLHPRQAGLATHLGVMVDRPTVGVAKSKLCGNVAGSIDDLAVGDRVPIVANHDVDAPAGTALGRVLQTRRFDSARNQINPLYVSPGHLVDADRAADLVMQACAGYKLPEPIREADAYADRVAASLSGS